MDIKSVVFRRLRWIGGRWDGGRPGRLCCAGAVGAVLMLLTLLLAACVDFEGTPSAMLPASPQAELASPVPSSRVPSTPVQPLPSPAPTGPSITTQSISPAPTGMAATLVVLAEPEAAQVYVDGQLRGRSPLTVTLAPGDHTVGVQMDGFLPIFEILTLLPGQEAIYAPVLFVTFPAAMTEPTLTPPAGGVTPTLTVTAVSNVSPTVTVAATGSATRPPSSPTVIQTPTATVPAPTRTPTPPPAVSLRVTEIVIPTYPFGPFLRPEADPNLGNYPVTVLDRRAYEAANPRPAPATYTLVVLENRYLRLSILPDLGGRIYECIFKPTGNNELYRNPVIKPTSWGPPYPVGANWWLAAGGIEWGFPVEEHGYEWGTPWGYSPVLLPDGSAQVTVYARDFRRPYVAVTIVLPADSAAFSVRPRIVNPNAAPFRFKWWANAMLAPGPANAPGPELRFIFSPGEMTVHSTGDPALPGPGQPFSWPIYNGRDLSRLGNWNQYLGFFQRPASRDGYMGVYDTAADEGMVRIYPPAVARGAKGFAMGWANPIGADNWTDDGSGYVELHGGLAPTFDDWAELPAGGEVSWSETWYPLAGIGGVTYADAAAALHVWRTADTLHVRIFPVRALAGQLRVTIPGMTPVTRAVDSSPARPFSGEIALSAGATTDDVTLTLTDARGQTVLAWRGGVLRR